MDAILLRLHEATSPEALGEIIYQTFVRCFGATFAPPNVPPSERTKQYFATLGEKAWTILNNRESEVHLE